MKDLERFRAALDVIVELAPAVLLDAERFGFLCKNLGIEIPPPKAVAKRAAKAARVPRESVKVAPPIAPVPDEPEPSAPEPSAPAPKRAQRTCGICGKPGHQRQTCPQRVPKAPEAAPAAPPPAEPRKWARRARLEPKEPAKPIHTERAECVTCGKEVVHKTFATSKGGTRTVADEHRAPCGAWCPRHIPIEILARDKREYHVEGRCPECLGEADGDEGEGVEA